MIRILALCAFGTLIVPRAQAEQVVLFDGSHLNHWEFRPGGWVIEPDGSMSCRMETVTAKNGTQRQRGMGYIWTKKSYGDFELTLSYKLSAGANSGVFFRTDKDNPVQGGFELQLLDNEGFQQSHGKKDAKNLNGAFYDCRAAIADPAKPAGQWNQLKIRCTGPRLQFWINQVMVNDVNIDDWDTPKQNPDGSPNKFKSALKTLPRTGRIGFQNHGQVVWIKDVTIRSQQQADWPQWRGPLGTGAAPGASPPLNWDDRTNLRWKTRLAGRGHSTPIVWGDRVFLTTAIPIGEKLEPRMSGRPGAHDNLPVDRKHQFMVIAIDRSNGKIVWRKEVHQAVPHEGGHYTASLASASPVTDGQHVYAYFGSHGLYGLNFEGDLIWRQQFGQMHTKHGHGEGTSPALSGDTLIINWDHEGDSFLVALDKLAQQPVGEFLEIEQPLAHQ